jgi:hypothetical protein
VTSPFSLTALGGRQLLVKDSGGARVDPGPCIFTAASDRVWAADDALHLTVGPIPGTQCGAWASTEAWLSESLGYGTYVVRVSGAFNSIDPQVTFGIFLWDDDAPVGTSCSADAGSSAPCAYREMDFEVSAARSHACALARLCARKLTSSRASRVRRACGTPH